VFCLENPDPLRARNLTIISKTLMNLGNLVLFGKKEPYLVACNTWLTSNMPKMKQYVDTISAFVDPSQVPTRSTLPIDYAQEMSHMHRFLDVKADAIKGIIEQSWKRLDAMNGELVSTSPPTTVPLSPRGSQLANAAAAVRFATQHCSPNHRISDPMIP